MSLKLYDPFRPPACPFERYAEQAVFFSCCIGTADEWDTTPALEAAIGYVLRRGWKVFPARIEDGKKWSWMSAERAPGGENWGMTADTEQLRRNFLKPEWRLKCGVGVPTGWVNRIFVLEADTLTGHGIDGLTALQGLEAKHGKLPDTLMAESPTGSLHYYFRHPGRGIKVKPSTSEIALGVDIKGDGGMVIAPPTVRGIGQYRWLNDLPIAEAPQWLLDLVIDTKPLPAADDRNAFERAGDEQTSNAWAEKALSNVADELRAEEKGKRNKKLYKCAFRLGTMVARGWLARDVVERELEDAAEKCGLTADDGIIGVRATIKSGLGSGVKCPHEELCDEKLDLPCADKKPPLIVEIGQTLWGPAMVNGKEYRFGADQSKVIDPSKSTWFDFTISKGGGIRELMKKVELANRGQSNADDVVTVRASDIVMRPLDWIWEGHLLRGSQELMSGLPDLCKSTIQIGYIACATAQLSWPDGAPAVEPMDVIMLTAEDTLEQIVVPRLRAAGANIDRVHILKCIRTDEKDRQFLLAEDLDRLERLVTRIGSVGLITIDPITAYMGSKMDSHKATEVRSQLGPLKDFAERLNICISTITHPAKAAGQRALDHFIGSQAFIAACRVGHLCVKETAINEDGIYVPTGRMLYTNVRNTSHHSMPTLAYRKLEVVAGTSGEGFGLREITALRIIWDGPVDITADAAVSAAPGKKGDAQPRVQALLLEMLKSGKPVLQTEIEEMRKAEGFSAKQLRTAREKLGVKPEKEKGKTDGKWFWQLPKE